MTTLEASKGAYRVATNQMADAIRKAALDGGHDARRFVLVAFGGGGPLHACAVARKLGISRVLIPSHPGLFSAHGIAISSFYHDYAQSVVRRLELIDSCTIERLFRQLEAEAEADLNLEGIPRHRWQIVRSLDMRYFGQSSEICVPVSSDVEDFSAASADFHKLHEGLYSYKVPSEPIELVNVRVRAIGHVNDLPIEYDVKADNRSVSHSHRLIHTPDRANPQTFAVYRRADLAPGEAIVGPAIVEEPSSSTIVFENCTANVDRFGNLLVGIEYHE